MCDPPGITFSSDPSGSRSVDELLFSSVDFLKPLSIIAFSVPILYPLATLKQQHTYINFITTTIHYNKKKHSPIGSARTTQIQQFFRVRALNGSRTRTPGLEDLYAAFASPEQIIMGMTGLEPASDGLKARCITVLLHTRMSHTGFEPVLED